MISKSSPKLASKGDVYMGHIYSKGDSHCLVNTLSLLQTLTPLGVPMHPHLQWPPEALFIVVRGHYMGSMTLAPAPDSNHILEVQGQFAQTITQTLKSTQPPQAHEDRWV